MSTQGTGTFPALDPEVSFPYTPVVPEGAPVKSPEWLNDPTFYHNRGDSKLRRRELRVRRLLRPGRPVHGAARGGRRHGRHLRAVGGPRGRRFPHRHHEARQHRVLAAVGPGDRGLREGDRRQRGLLHVRRGLQRQRRAAVDVHHEGRGARRSSTSASRTRPRASRPAAASAVGMRDFFAADDYYIDADSNAYSLPTFLGNHDMGRIGTFIAQANPGAVGRRAAGPRPARARPHVLLARHAGRLLRRRAGLHGRRRRQGRPAGPRPQRRPRSTWTTTRSAPTPPRPTTTSTPATRCTRPWRAGGGQAGPRGAALRRAAPALRRRRPGRLRLLPRRPRRAAGVPGRQQQRRGRRASATFATGTPGRDVHPAVVDATTPRRSPPTRRGTSRSPCRPSAPRCTWPPPRCR